MSVVAGPFDAELRAAAAAYRGYERVSDRGAFAPVLCRAPVPSEYVFASSSDDPATHGRKLYFLYASDAAAYNRMSWHGQTTSPVGQTLVKETWSIRQASWEFEPEIDGTPVAPSSGPVTAADVDALPETHAWDGERIVRMDEPGDLFIMLKKDPRTPGTDHGWVYGVVSRDGQTVRAAGMIASCIGCHEKTGRDRLFGHPGSWEQR